MHKYFTFNDLRHHEEINDMSSGVSASPVSTKKLPGKAAIQNILSYSRSLVVVQTSSSGQFDLLLN
jgi:hypothetical protein